MRLVAEFGLREAVFGLREGYSVSRGGNSSIATLSHFRTVSTSSACGSSTKGMSALTHWTCEERR